MFMDQDEIPWNSTENIEKLIFSVNVRDFGEKSKDRKFDEKSSSLINECYKSPTSVEVDGN